MGQARQRIEKIKQQQIKRVGCSTAPTTESGSIHDRTQYLTALGGVVVGLLIAAVIWLAKPLVAEDNHDSIQPEAAEVISSDEARKTNDNITRLNHRMEMLAETISIIDAKYRRILVMAESMAAVENKNAYRQQELLSDPPVNASDIGEDNSGKSRAGNTAYDAGEEITPTHVVNARINLRPSMSLDTTPIAVLEIGTEVEYISKTDGWYYVNTRTYGKGWCSSDYLSSLQDAP